MTAVRQRRGGLVSSQPRRAIQVRGCALSADGRLALSASDDGTLRLWDTETGDCLVEMAMDDVLSATLAADELVVLAGDTNGGVSFFRVIEP